MKDRAGALTALPRFEDHHHHLDALRSAALRAADPAEAVRRYLTPADGAHAERVFMVGAGKAGAAMARAAAEVLQDRLSAGVVAVPHLPAECPARVTFVEGGHPRPTEGSLAAGRAIASLLAQTTERDLVVALISGGGSALLELPREGLALEDLQATTAALLRCGATIHEFNTVRAHLSRIKAGGLAQLAHPARVLALIMSDVVGNHLDIIASGPTVFSKRSPAEALAVIERYHLRPSLPPAVLACLLEDERRPSETKPLVSAQCSLVENRLIASNRLACEAALAAAREIGFEAIFLGDDWQGEAREVGARFAAETRRRGPGSDAVREAASMWRPACVVAGGESTVAVRGPGTGGRNQEAALAAALAIAGQPNLVIATLATDGVDGPTDAAGAVVTGETIARARALGLDPHRHLNDNDAYPFFAALGALTLTGPTGTNVNDVLYGLAY